MGTIAQLGSQFQVDVKVISATDGKALVAYSHRADGEAAALDDYASAARQLSKALAKKLNRTLTAEVTTVSSSGTQLRGYAWMPAVAAGVFAAGSVFALAQAVGHHNDLVQGRPIANPAAYGQEGSTYQTVGWGLVVGAAAGLTAAGLMYGLGGPPQARATIALSPGGFSLGIAGPLP
jgi:hypothetical protein